MSKLIPLRGKYGKGKFAIVDDADFERLNQYKWHVDAAGYPTRRTRNVEDARRLMVLMHYMILPAKDGLLRDHKNRNRFDNRRENLRYATKNQNGANSRSRKNEFSRYRGVSWSKTKKKWHASISMNRKTLYLGRFTIEEAAARAYDNAAMAYHGEFAVLNFPLVVEDDALNR